jgi:hypothetical protein
VSRSQGAARRRQLLLNVGTPSSRTAGSQPGLSASRDGPYWPPSILERFGSKSKAAIERFHGIGRLVRSWAFVRTHGRARASMWRR